MFKLVFTERANEQYFDIIDNPAKEGLAKQVDKALEFLKINPRHPSLHTHKNQELSSLHKRPVFQAYVQNYTPGAYRIFFIYSRKDEITITSIEAHPN